MSDHAARIEHTMRVTVHINRVQSIRGFVVSCAEYRCIKGVQFDQLLPAQKYAREHLTHNHRSIRIHPEFCSLNESRRTIEGEA